MQCQPRVMICLFLTHTAVPLLLPEPTVYCRNITGMLLWTSSGEMKPYLGKCLRIFQACSVKYGQITSSLRLIWKQRKKDLKWSMTSSLASHTWRSLEAVPPPPHRALHFTQPPPFLSGEWEGLRNGRMWADCTKCHDIDNSHGREKN